MNKSVQHEVIAGEVSIVETQPKSFLFTRHALSCNNTNQGKYRGKDYEPSITTLGIDQLVNYDTNIPDNIFKFTDDYVDKNPPEIQNITSPQPFTLNTFKQNNHGGKLHVVVSPLIRTWETAVVLYLTANETSTELNLYIGPYLKEKLDKQIGLLN